MPFEAIAFVLLPRIVYVKDLVFEILSKNFLYYQGLGQKQIAFLKASML